MKSLVFVAILLTSYLSSASIIAQQRALGFASLDELGRISDVNQDLDDIIALIPRTQIEGIVNSWIAKDQEVKNDWNYATSDNVEDHVKKLEGSNEFLKVKQQLEGVHINVAHFANIIHEIIGMGPMDTVSRMKRSNSGLRGCLDEVRSTIPMTQIILKVGQKLIFSSQFRGLVSLLKNNDFKNNVNTLMSSEVVTGFIQDCKNNGIDTQAVYDFIQSLSPIYTETIGQDY